MEERGEVCALCGCRGKEKECTIGCECINCTNTPAKENFDVAVDEYLEEVTAEFVNILEDCNNILEWVFGEDIADPEDPAENQSYSDDEMSD